MLCMWRINKMLADKIFAQNQFSFIIFIQYQCASKFFPVTHPISILQKNHKILNVYKNALIIFFYGSISIRLVATIHPNSAPFLFFIYLYKYKKYTYFRLKMFAQKLLLNEHINLNLYWQTKNKKTTQNCFVE